MCEDMNNILLCSLPYRVNCSVPLLGDVTSLPIKSETKVMQLWLQGLPNQTNECEIVWVNDRKWADYLSYEQPVPGIILPNDFDTYTTDTFYVINNKLNEIDFIILLHKELNGTRCYQINPSSLECRSNLIWKSSTDISVWNLTVTQFFPKDCQKR